jgi:hypothetical protein
MDVFRSQTTFSGISRNIVRYSLDYISHQIISFVKLCPDIAVELLLTASPICEKAHGQNSSKVMKHALSVLQRINVSLDFAIYLFWGLTLDFSLIVFFLFS